MTDARFPISKPSAPSAKAAANGATVGNAARPATTGTLTLCRASGSGPWEATSFGFLKPRLSAFDNRPVNAARWRVAPLQARHDVEQREARLLQRAGVFHRVAG